MQFEKGIQKTQGSQLVEVVYIDLCCGMLGYGLNSSHNRVFPLSWFYNGEETAGNPLFSLVPKKTVTIPRTKLPAPLQEEPKQGQKVIRLSLSCDGYWVDSCLYFTHPTGEELFNAGFLFDNESDAQEWADFLNKIHKLEPDND